MAKTQAKDLDLSWHALLVAIPSFAVYLLNDQLLAAIGSASIAPLDFPQEFAIRLEHGARLELLAAFLLFVAVACAVMASFATSLWALNSAARVRIAIGVALLTLVAIFILWRFPTPGIPADIGMPSHCPAIDARGVIGTEPRACSMPAYVDLLWLLGIWKWGLIAATAAVIFGTICCLAGAPPASTRTTEIAVLKHQAARLRLFLYLSAMLLVSALLVQLTFLRWPRFAVLDTGQFDTHVSAIMLYYGVGYSVFLASYYLPVAFWLGRRAERLADKDLRDEIFRTATHGPAAVVKTAATILAPALAGLLSAWIDLPV